MRLNTEMDPTVYCIGETVLDIIFSEGRPESAVPGGSMLNSAVSLARSGLNVELISEYGNDPPGDIIADFLQKNNVGTRFINRYDDGKTAIALAFLDQKRNATYSFHKSYPQVRLKEPLPVTGKGDVILFGSIYSITAGIHDKIIPWVKKARAMGTLIVYDPNFRKSHLEMLEKVRPWIAENLALADMVRGSDEDFSTIFALQKPDAVRNKLLSLGCKNLIITRNSKSLVAWFDDLHMTVKIPNVKPLISTIGAGDSFNAGLIYALVSGGFTLTNLGDSEARKIIGSGISFASDVCKSIENYISSGFSKTLRS